MFLRSRELVGVRMEWIRSVPSSLYGGGAALLIVALVLFQMKAGRDPTTAKFEGRQLVHVILTKVVFACKSFWW